MVNLDMTFCASPNCVNECGRKFTIEHEIAAKRCGKPYHSFAYFCDKTEEPKEV